MSILRMKKRASHLLIIVSVFILFISVGFAVAQDIKKPPHTIPVPEAPDITKIKPPSADQRPDLIVSWIQISTESVVLDGRVDRYRLNITIHIKNQGLSSTYLVSSGGRFKVLVEERIETGNFNHFCEFTVPVLDAGKEYSRFCKSQIIPRGEQREYRARVDYLNWINESNETNNEKIQRVLIP